MSDRTLKPSSHAARLGGDRVAATASIVELGAADQINEGGLGAAAVEGTKGPLVTETAELAAAARSATDSTPRDHSSAVKMARICSEECGAPYSRNGICDDGRPTLAGGGAGAPAAAGDGTSSLEGRRPVHCDLGTDCTDCGAFVAPHGEAAGWRPIAEIRRKGFDVFTRRSETPWPFWMAYTDPS